MDQKTNTLFDFYKSPSSPLFPIEVNGNKIPLENDWSKSRKRKSEMRKYSYRDLKNEKMKQFEQFQTNVMYTPQEVLVFDNKGALFSNPGQSDFEILLKNQKQR